jgi:phosphoribosylformylglycinamidine synthase
METMNGSTLYPEPLYRGLAQNPVDAGGYPKPREAWPPMLKPLWPSPYRDAVAAGEDDHREEATPMARYLARVYVSLKPTVNDPPGLTIAEGLRSLGFDSVTGVRAGKYVEIRLTAPDIESARRQADAMCDQLLANPVIETYRFEVEEASG